MNKACTSPYRGTVQIPHFLSLVAADLSEMRAVHIYRKNGDKHVHMIFYCELILRSVSKYGYILCALSLILEYGYI